MSLDAHVAVQTVEMRHMRRALERIEAAQGEHVLRREWEQRNGFVDGRFRAVDDEILAAKKRQDEDRKFAESQRAPWWVVLGAALGVLSAVVALLSYVNP